MFGTIVLVVMVTATIALAVWFILGTPTEGDLW